MHRHIHVLTKTSKSLIFVERIPKHYHIPIHQHKNKESFHICKGKGHFYTNGELVLVQKGMKIDISPGIDHGIFTKDEPLECFVVIEGDDSDEIMNIYFDLMKGT
jgi:quercetin dioxygenase-like cupin family protein